MDAHLNIDTIKENRNFKGITQEDTKELIDTLYAFSVLSYEAYTKKNTQSMIFQMNGIRYGQKQNIDTSIRNRYI